MISMVQCVDVLAVNMARSEKKESSPCTFLLGLSYHFMLKTVVGLCRNVYDVFF